MSKLELQIFDSLRRVFLDEKPSYPTLKNASALKDDVFNCQISLCLAEAVEGERLRAYPTIKSEIADKISLFRVANVPSEMPSYSVTDGKIERKTPGLYPDPLFPLNKDGIFGKEGLYYSLWLQISTKNLEAKKYNIEVSFENDKKEYLSKIDFDFEVLDAKLPKQKLIFTQWLHPDCLVSNYNVPAFSEEHWRILENFIRLASENGINMLMTPLFTLPLDTVVGGERPTTQLIDVEKVGKKYKFGFEKLSRWVALAKKCKIRYFEFSHFFTQWGAEATPKIVAKVGGKEKRIFGWDTVASGKEYENFLSQFLPALDSFIKENRLEKSVYFHVSDEPNEKQIETYTKASNLLRKYLNPKYPIIDALSDHVLYEKGLVDNPIPATDRYEPFIKDKIKERWAYYCCTQNKEVSNRFFSMSQARNRILGMQLYKYGIKGFLHWGYNFWYTQYSLSEIDPFMITDAGGIFPSGDSFSAYPAKDGTALPSTRLFVFAEAIHDLSVLQALEKKIGREKTLALLENDLDEPLTFKNYPLSADWLLNKRTEINKALLG